MTIREVLNGAADLIESKGWTQGSFRDECGYCASGSIFFQPAVHVRELYAAAQLLEKNVGQFPVAWNDAPGRTAAQGHRKAARSRSVAGGRVTWNGDLILTQCVYPPIPVRSFDWQAMLISDMGRCGCEECQRPPTGWASSEMQSVCDLVERLMEI